MCSGSTHYTLIAPVFLIVFILVGDFVFLRGPPAEVYELATFRTKGFKRVLFPCCLFLAYRTPYLHNHILRRSCFGLLYLDPFPFHDHIVHRPYNAVCEFGRHLHKSKLFEDINVAYLAVRNVSFRRY